MRVVVLTLSLLLLAAAPAAHAQLFSTRLPTPYAGDYLNGVAASDAAGGLFVTGDRARPTPAVAFGVPTAFGANGRDVYAVASGHVGRSPSGWFRDGAVFLGTGLGNSRRLIGVEATFAVYDLVGDTFAERSLSVKLHRRLGTRWAVAAGMENMILAGRTDGGKSVYGVVSGSLPLRGEQQAFGRLTLTAGVGDGRFNAYENVRRGRNAAGVFGAAALRLVPRVSALVSWTGQDLNAGLSWAPFPEWAFVVTPVLLDVDRRGGHGEWFAFSVGLGTTF